MVTQKSSSRTGKMLRFFLRCKLHQLPFRGWLCRLSCIGKLGRSSIVVRHPIPAPDFQEHPYARAIGGPVRKAPSEGSSDRITNGFSLISSMYIPQYDNRFFLLILIRASLESMIRSFLSQQKRTYSLTQSSLYKLAQIRHPAL